MSAQNRTAPPARRPSWRVLTLIAALVMSALGAGLGAGPAHAAAQGAGFGSWAPVSAYGWHGSMIIDGVHTYCILPGAPAPTGPSDDRGISTTAAGLTAAQLTGINHLVTTYGQTDDPVRAAAVGWAVKAIADWDETLHHFGYRGDSLAGAVHWTFSALAPAHSAEVQRLAVAYYREGMDMAPGATVASGHVVFTTDAADHRLGSVRVEATESASTGTLRLEGATFADTGTRERSDAAPGVDYPIVTSPPTAGRAYTVAASGTFAVSRPLAAVRHFTTAGGQDTAGPAGRLEFTVHGADAAPRVPVFAPTISTQVASTYAAGGAFVDDVRFEGVVEDWPRDDTGAYLPLTATAEVYRTATAPSAVGGAVPDHAVHVGSLGLTTAPAIGPTDTYRVSSLWELDEPGFYTAVWSVRADGQDPAVIRHLPADYSWTESFGEPTQITMVADVSSAAEPTVEVGATMSDRIIVAGPLPDGGLTVTSAVYRAVDGLAPADSCADEALVWTSAPHVMTAPGEHVVVSPAVTLPGIYYWQERAVDSRGELVHLGRCGVPHETTHVTPAEAPARSDSERGAPSALAATGLQTSTYRTGAAVGVLLLTGGGTLLTLSRRRRLAALGNG